MLAKSIGNSPLILFKLLFVFFCNNFNTIFTLPPNFAKCNGVNFFLSWASIFAFKFNNIFTDSSDST